jgi:surface polysaccharide O-acyltransferase-like enzyme
MWYQDHLKERSDVAQPITETTAVPQPRRPRLASLDVLRAFAAVAVVLIHTSAAVLLHTPHEARGWQVAGFINQFCRFAVPAFVLITGAGLFHNYGQRSSFSPGQYYLRRLKSIGIPYLFWSFAYFTLYRWMEQDFHQFLPRFLDVLATATANYTFYFFPIIVPFYLLFPLVRPLARSKWMGMAALIGIAGNGFFVWFAFPQPKVALGPLLSQLYAYAGNTPLWWMGPFFLGAWLVTRWDAATAWLRRYWIGLTALAAFLLVWVMQEFHAYVGMGKLAYVATNFRPSAYSYGLVIMLAMVGLGAVLSERAGWAMHAIESFSKYSFTVYLVHPLVQQATSKVLSPLSIGPLIHFVLQGCLVIGLSYVLARAIDKVPGGSWVIGVR